LLAGQRPADVSGVAVALRFGGDDLAAASAGKRRNAMAQRIGQARAVKLPTLCLLSSWLVISGGDSHVIQAAINY